MADTPRCGACTSFAFLEDESVYGSDVGCCTLAFGHAVANIDNVGFQVLHTTGGVFFPGGPGDGRECTIGLLVRRDFYCARFKAID